MQINFNENAKLKKYNLKFKSELEAGRENTIDEKEIPVKIGWDKDNIEIYIQANDESDRKIDEFFNIINKPFEALIYKLNQKGEIEDLINYGEILGKWNDLKKEIKLNKDNEKLFFKFTGMVSNMESCKELLKRFSIVPYLFPGFYNQEIKKNLPLKKNGILYNVYETDDIEVKYEIFDGSVDETEKIILLSGKDNPTFDRSSFVKKIYESYSEIPLHKIGNFDLNCSGKYTYSLENILKEMEFLIHIEIKSLVDYKIYFNLKETE